MLDGGERRVVSIAIAVLFAVGAIYVLAPILTLFLLAALLAYIANPLVRRLEALHVPRTVTILFLLLVAMLAVTALLLMLIPMAKKEILTFSTHLPDYTNWLQAQIEHATNGRYTLDLHVLKHRILRQWQSVGAGVGKLLSVATYSGLHVLGWLARLMLILVIAFYLLRDWDRILRTIGELIPRSRREQATRWASEVDHALGRLLRGQLSVMLSMAFLYSAGLSLAGLDLALPIGVMTGLISFIPYLGFFTGLLTASLAALLQYHDLHHLLLVFAVFLVAEMMESMVLGPRLVGRSLGWHPVLVIFAVLTGGRLLGFAGILLALPISAVTTVWIRHVHEQNQDRAWTK